jgi:hypothetical protein
MQTKRQQVSLVPPNISFYRYTVGEKYEQPLFDLSSYLFILGYTFARALISHKLIKKAKVHIIHYRDWLYLFFVGAIKQVLLK